VDGNLRHQAAVRAFVVIGAKLEAVSFSKHARWSQLGWSNTLPAYNPGDPIPIELDAAPDQMERRLIACSAGPFVVPIFVLA
jgi:hypothetical protein